MSHERCVREMLDTTRYPLVIALAMLLVVVPLFVFLPSSQATENLGSQHNEDDLR